MVDPLILLILLAAVPALVGTTVAIARLPKGGWPLALGLMGSFGLTYVFADNNPKTNMLAGTIGPTLGMTGGLLISSARALWRRWGPASRAHRRGP